MSKLFVQVERVEDLIGRVDNYFGGERVMTEYIKREDAIEALGEEPYVWSDTDVEIAEHAQWVSDVKAIEAVPSADVIELELSPICYKCDGKTAGVRTEKCLWLNGDNSKCIEQAHKLLHLAEREDSSVVSREVYEGLELICKNFEDALKDSVDELEKVERKKGKWIDYKCSECGEPIPISKVILRGEVMWERHQKPNFCSNCGAQMEGDDNNA